MKKRELILLEEDCVMVKLNHDILSHCQKFECGNTDLDDESFEKDFFNIGLEDSLRTRMMYFDLKL